MISRLKTGLCALGILLAILGWPLGISQGASDSLVSPAQLIQFLNQTIAWYHQITIEEQIATQPDEQMTLYNNRQIADQAIRLAFDFARAQAGAKADQSGSNPVANPGEDSSQFHALRQMQANLDKSYQDTQTELDSDREKLGVAAGARRVQLQSEISELQGELALTQARRDAVRSMVEFVNGSATGGSGTTGLRAQIEALAATVPAAASSPSDSGQARSSPPTLAPVSNQPEASGIWELTAELFGLSSKLGTIDSVIRQTDSLSKSGKDLRAPFVTQLRALSNKGDQLANEADAANRSLLEQEKKQLDDLAAQFKQNAAAVIPLSKQGVLLGLYKTNLVGWRDTVEARYKADLRKLGVRLGFLGLILAALIAMAELWRRAVYRYVHEPRRRYQFLLIRKFTLWVVVALIIALTLSGKLGSIATFAGLLTAGIAVALQNVIVSIVGYFFLIGKFGIKVGDRVQASGIAGEVIDIGLVRFHLMETGAGGTPTGRVVAFSNSIVFQPSSGLFKQIPGASFAWHEVTLTLPRNVDFSLIRKKLLEAVENVIRDYQDEIERQYREMERTGILLSEQGLRPKLELRLSPGGVEATIRYPVDLQQATDIDARISRELLTAVETASMLKGTETPEIRLNTDVSAGSTS